GAKHDATLHFGTEASATGLAIHAEQCRFVNAQAVTNAVIAREVRTGLRRGDDVIGGEGVVGVRHANVHRFAAGLVKQFDSFFTLIAHSRIHPLAEVVARDADSHALHRSAHVVRISRHGRGGGSGVVRIAAGNGL